MPDPRSTPDPDDVVRRLLAQARHDEPVPDDVARRLDRVLDTLRDEPAGGSGGSGSGSSAPVASLDGWRHRRRATVRLLVAAAAVLVVGVGIAHVVGDRESPADSGSSASSAQRPVRGSGSAAGQDSVAPAGGSYADIRSELPLPLASNALRRGARAAISLAAQLDPSLQNDGPLAAALAGNLPGWSCGTGTSTQVYGAGVLLPATYDGGPVVLALRPTGGDGQPVSVEVLACASGGLLHSITVDPT